MIGLMLVAGYFLARVPSLTAHYAPALRKAHVFAPHAPLVLFITLFLIISAALVLPRNIQWKNNEVFFTTTLEQNPNAHILRRELGEVLYLKGDLEGARYHFDYLIQNAPDWKDITMAYKGMGDYWRAQGEEEKTLQSYIRATETGFSARDFVVYNDVGVVFMERGQYLLGFSYLCQSLQLLPEGNPAAASLNSAIAIIEEEYIESAILHTAIRDQFAPAQEPNIQHLGTRCDATSCQNAFAVNPQSLDVIPPFLITATQPHAWKKDTQVPIEITNQSFDPSQSVIILETDAQYENTEITFLFPTCSREYYEAITMNNEQ